jgi:hypothetical protein
LSNLNPQAACSLRHSIEWRRSFDHWSFDHHWSFFKSLTKISLFLIYFYWNVSYNSNKNMAMPRH